MVVESATRQTLEILTPADLPAFPPMQTCGIANDDVLVEMWLRQYDNSRTKAKYSAAVARLRMSLVHGIRRATVPELARYEDGLKKGLQAASVRWEMAVIGSLFGFAQRAGYIDRSPAHVYRKRRIRPRLGRRALGEDIILRLIGGAATERDRVLIEFLYVSGARAIEIGRCPDPDRPGQLRNSLTWEQIHVVDGHAIVNLLGKGSKWRTIKLPPRMTSRLMALRQGAPDSHSVFTSSKDDDGFGLHYVRILAIFKQAALRSQIGIEVTPHALRRSHATHASRKGKNLTDIQDALGHASIETTRIYIEEQDAVMIGDVLATELQDG